MNAINITEPGAQIIPVPSSMTNIFNGSDSDRHIKNEQLKMLVKYGL